MESIDILGHPDNFLDRLLLAVVVYDRHGVEGDDRKRDVDWRFHRDVQVL
jgi:hypothetical protein